MSEHSAQQAGTADAPASGVPSADVSAVRAYAGAFCGEQHAAADLAAEVLAHAPQHPGPTGRLDLLAAVRRTADAWVRQERAALLRPGFRSWAQRAADTFGPVDTLRRVEHTSLLLAAFATLPDQARAALWLCRAEQGETALAAEVLGTTEEFAESMAESARARLADGFLRLRAEHTEDARCVHYGTMLGAIARGTHRETPDDLRRHLDGCRFCAHDFTLLHTLTSGAPEELRALLVDQVLVWGGPAYRTARQPETAPVAPREPEPETATPPAPEPARRRRPVLAVAIAVVVTAVATTAALKLLGDDSTAQAANAATAPSVSAPAPTASPTPSPSAGASIATLTLENTATGRCVAADAGSSFDNVPRTATCAEGPTQQWNLVPSGKNTYALEHVASKFCLDIAGDRVTGDPMQLRPCAYQQGDDAPYPKDQAFLLKTRADGTFTLVCQDNQDIAVGVRDGEVRMLVTAGSGEAIRFQATADLTKALGG
ncbi:RICIN domain-containing protein [Streptomyces justiciae]|uniref:RICIN domain-containing protein n=1 Tax=Streptomyces justiciae TaxID=2780140 RepID=A0ABU3M3V9_9ACTN|nr:RICIN domain-containing protein [Streptomyces justiciae]MDT7846189.1 RICIN domain-containing protein [Streptomyces justiciae]